MRPRAIDIYHRLPQPARSAVASARGYYLRAFRYGPETHAQVEAALEREQWTPRAWNEWTELRLERLLHRAATAVPYYREQWLRRRRNGDRASWEQLENWPVLKKSDVRSQPLAFVVEGARRRSLFHEQTSGTTGTPLDLWFGRETVRAWYALCEARIRAWNGLDRTMKWAMMGGQLVTPVSQTRPPFWVWNAGLHQLYLSSYHLSLSSARAYLAAITAYGVEYAMGYASSLYTLARATQDLGLSAPSLRVAISNAEPLYDHQREAVAAAFACDVRDTYGMCEICCAGSECSSNRTHLWPEAGVLEVLDATSARHVPDGAVGRFVCTGLLNVEMPLVRYEVGDRGAMCSSAAPCACGRTLPVLERIEGRSDDVLVTRDGRMVGRLDPVFKTDAPIREAQVVQESLSRVRVRVVPAPGYSARHFETISRCLRDRLGDIEVVEEVMASLPRSANGKLRMVVSELEERDRRHAARTGGSRS